MRIDWKMTEIAEIRQDFFSWQTDSADEVTLYRHMMKDSSRDCIISRTVSPWPRVKARALVRLEAGRAKSS